ncbi:MAG: MarR family transcriptional regulator [Betaproteobacteria bacterium]|nr:MarR family transcriptional regulator [Betaproteobacteria bacterium]
MPKRPIRANNNARIATRGRHPCTTTLPSLVEGNSDARFRRLVYDFLTLSARMRTMREHLGEQAGLTAPQYTFLMAVMELGEHTGVTMTELADYLLVTPAFVTHESNVLVRSGLIVKRANPQDGRSSLLSLSEKGWRLVSKLIPEVRAVNDLFFSQLDETTFRRAQQLLALLLEGSEHAMGYVAAGRAVKGLRNAPGRDRQAPANRPRGA